MGYESLDGAPRWPPALTGPYWELDGPAHARHFTVANLAKLDVLADIKGAVQAAIDSGKTERWFRQQIEGTLRQKGWWGPQVQVDPDTLEARIIQAGSRRRLQTIYRTNLQSAYMARRHAQALEQADRAPFAQYLAVRDSRTRPAHGALHGKVFRLDSPEWSVISPPNGYNCRCRARYMSQRELESRGLKPETDVRLLERTPEKVPKDILTGETPARIVERGVSVPSRARPGERDVLWADRGWDHLPGSDGAERALVDRVLEKAATFGPSVTARMIDAAPLAAAGAMIRRLAAEEDLARWFAAPEGNQPLAVIPPLDREVIGAKTGVAVLSPETAAKQAVRHPELTPAEYARAQEVVDRHTARVQDSDNSLVYALEEEDGGEGGGYVLVIKATRTGEGLFVTSYRRLSRDDATRDAEVARLLRKHKK